MAYPHITVWTYLWDLVDDGIDAVLREMRDDLGLTALSVATSYHSVEHLRPHTRGAMIYRSDSALYFTPDLTRYARTAIRHQVAPLAAAGNPLRQVSDRAAELGLDLVAWTVCCHSSWLGRQYPRCTQENAAGSPGSPGSHYPETLCPANPDVREFIKAMVDDLTHNYRIAIAELESCHYAPARHYHQHGKICLDLGPAGTLLMMLCFCEHCRARAQAARVDAERLRAQVTEAIRRMLDAPRRPAGTVEELTSNWAELQAYLRVRVEVVHSLIEEVRGVSASPVSPIKDGGWEASGLEIGRLGATHSVTIAAYSADPAEVRRIIEAAAAAVGDVARLRVGFHTFPPVIPDRESLLRVVGAAKDLGVRSYSFYNYGIAPRESLGWMRDAVRVIRE